MIKKKIQVWLPLLFSLTLIAGMYLGYKMRDNMPGKNFFYIDKPHPVEEIMNLINNRYVDEVNMNELSDTAIQAMLSKLDPHSVFIPANELQMVNEELTGKFYGIGIEFNIFDDTLNVINIIKNGPSFKAGLMPGDKFIKINDSTVAGNKTTADTFRKLLRGSRGSKVTISILHKGKIRQTVIPRDAIPLSSVDASYMIDSQIGFIRLNKFTTQTYREFMLALDSLNKAGMKKLILDLRGNGGGILEEAIEIADEFLSGDKLITYTVGNHIAKKEYRCRRTGQFETGELVVLADEGTASASEVLLGALQDWDRATIVGRRTFGKGLVQEQFDLSDHSALRLTIARYYTPVGRSIQRTYTNGSKAYYEEINNSHYEDSTYIDSANKASNKVFKTKAGKKVYANGGITPDLFIEPDTTTYTPNSLKIYNGGLISNFAYHYYLQNEEVLQTYKTPGDFIKRFEFNEVGWKDFVIMAAKDSINISKTGIKEKENIVNLIKSSIARQLWRTEGYFEMLNVSDKTLKRALDILHK